MRCRTLLVIATAALLPLLGLGCERDTPEPPPGSPIPLKVWVVLGTQGSDVFDQSGFNDNQGCRLSAANITSYIEGLQNNRHIFGATFEFTWDTTIEEVRTQHIPFDFGGLFPTERRTSVPAAMQDLLSVQGKWTANHVNIYFAGWLTSTPGTSQKPTGLTLDPSSLMGPSNAHIIINDRGWNTDSGSQVDLSDHSLEHEMAHFLLRRGGVSPYDVSEHVTNGSQNILDELGPHPLILPTSEQQETANRIKNGTWPNP